MILIMNTNDKKLEPVMVYCPYSKQTINLAPFLQYIHEDFLGFDCAAEEIDKIIEGFTTQGNVMEDSPCDFRNYICTLYSLKHSFINIKNGERV